MSTYLEFRGGARRLGEQWVLALVLLAAIIVASACGSGENQGNGGGGGDGGRDAGSDAPSDPEDIRGEELASRRVGPGGAVIEADGVHVTVPEGALATETNIRIGRLTSRERAALPMPFIEGLALEPVSDVFALTPHGTTFGKAVTVTLNHGGGAQLILRLLGSLPFGDWEFIRATSVSDSSISSETDVFSYYAAFRFSKQPTLCDMARCDGDEVKSCTARDAGCWKRAPYVELSPPDDSVDKRVASYDTVSHGVDVSSQFPVRYQAVVWSNVDLYGPDVEDKRFALSFFPLHENELPTQATTIQTEAVPWPRDKVDYRNPMAFEVSAILQFGADYMILGVGEPFSYAPQPLLYIAFGGGSGTRYQLREVRPTITDTTGMLEEFKSWADLRMLSREGMFGVKDGNNLHVIVDLRDEVSFQRPQPVVRWTIPVDEISKSGTDPEPATVRTIQSQHILRPAEDYADLLGIAPVRDDGGDSVRNAVAMLWNEAHTVKRSTGEFTYETTTYYDHTGELRDIRSGTVADRRLLNRATYASDATGPQSDCLLNNPVQPTNVNFIFARDASVSTDGVLRNMASLSGGYGGQIFYAASDLTSNWSTCAEPIDFDPNMHVARLLNATFAPGAGREFTSFSALWGFADYEYHETRFGLVHVPNVASKYFQTDVFESPSGSLSIVAATATLGGHRVFAFERAAGTSLRLYTLDVHETGAFVNRAGGKRPEDFGPPSAP